MGPIATFRRRDLRTAVSLKRAYAQDSCAAIAVCRVSAIDVRFLLVNCPSTRLLRLPAGRKAGHKSRSDSVRPVLLALHGRQGLCHANSGHRAQF